MANKAQEQLQGLLDMRSDAESSQANLAKLNEARTQFIASGGDEADFAWPEAAVVAAGIGWVLGPVGGLLIGTAAGFLGKERKQAALDEYAADVGALRLTDEVFNDQLDRMALTTTNPDDLLQLSTLQTQKDAAMQMMNSASPELQQQGMQMMSDFSTSMNEYSVRQEEQKITADAYDTQLKRDLDATQYSQYNTSISSFRSESAGYEAVMSATDIALDALTSGTPSDLWAAGILINKALDPTGVVRQEEAEAVGAIGSLWNKANTLMEKARSGQTMLPEQREELSGLLYRMRESGTEFQLAREARYADEITDIGLPLKYHDNFKLARTVPASVQGDMQNVATLPSEDIDKAASDAIFPYTDQGIANNLKYAWGNIKTKLGIKPAVPETAEDRRLRIERHMTDPGRQ